MPEGLVTPPASAPAAAFRWPHIVVSVRENPAVLRRSLALVLAVLAGVAISVLVLLAAGVPAADLAEEFLVNSLTDPDSQHAILAQAAPLILVGAGAALAFRVNYWNLGLEGQMIFGAIFASFFALHHMVPDVFTLSVMALAACAGGAFWAVAPAVLKLMLGINEIITTLLLNYVAQNFLLHLVYGPWLDPKDSFPHSPAFPDAARLPEFASPGGVFGGIFGGVLVGAGLVIAVVLALAAWGLVSGTRLGLYMRFAQANPRMAGALGVPLRLTLLTSVLLSAVGAGMAGFVIAAGEEGRLTQSFYAGYGFSGILIAFLARNSPLGAIVVSVALAWLFVTGQSLQVFYQIPFSMVQLIQAIIVIAVAASEFFVRHRVHLVR